MHGEISPELHSKVEMSKVCYNVIVRFFVASIDSGTYEIFNQLQNYLIFLINKRHL